MLLPTEDLENDCLTALVGQIFSEMILGEGIGGKACEPWLLWEAFTKIAEVIQEHLPKSKARVRLERSNSGSNSDLGESTPPAVSERGIRRWEVGKSVEKWFWLILQYAFLAFTAARFAIISISNSSTLPRRVDPWSKIHDGMDVSFPNEDTKPSGLEKDMRTPAARRRPTKQPILAMKIWSCISRLLDADSRMPWLSATMSLLQWGAITGPGSLGNTDGMIDRYVNGFPQVKHITYIRPIFTFFLSFKRQRREAYVTPHEISVT